MHWSIQAQCNMAMNLGLTVEKVSVAFIMIITWKYITFIRILKILLLSNVKETENLGLPLGSLSASRDIFHIFELQT